MKKKSYFGGIFQSMSSTHCICLLSATAEKVLNIIEEQGQSFQSSNTVTVHLKYEK